MPSGLTIPTQALYILHKLQTAGFEAYIVGGAVRDILLLEGASLPPEVDFDFTTNAKPEEILKLFPESFYENNFGTVMITYEDLCSLMGVEPETDQFQKQSTQNSTKVIDLAQAGKVHESLDTPSEENLKLTVRFPNFEITTFRSDGAYSDHRRPDEVTWGETIEEDLERRDFTINSMALAIPIGFLETSLNSKEKNVSVSDYQLIDPHHGQQDLEARVLKTVGDPNKRFQEDALRMLRAIRFALQLDLRIEENTLSAVKSHAGLIEKISAERVRDEFMKMLASSKPATGIELLDETGLLEKILPEILTGKGVNQGGHHTTDVWTHSLEALRECPSPDPVVRLATLLHDVAKPETYQEKDGQITFYSHEIVGSRIAYRIAKRFKLSKKDTDRIFTLVRYHMFHYQPHNTDAAIRRFMRKVGLENIDDILDLREGDRLGSGARKTSWRLEEMKQRMINQLHQPMEVKDLAISGHEIMESFNLKPGPVIGEVLNALFEKVLDEPELNNKEKLLELTREIISQNSSN